MRTIKKLLCIVMLFCLAYVPVEAEEESYDYSKEISFLTQIGVTGINSASQNSSVTRGEAVLSMAEAMNYQKNSAQETQVFLDVTKSHSSFSAAWYLKSIGVLSDSADKKFRPDDFITKEELIKMATVALGYEQYAKIKGGYPYGYMNAASRVNLLTKMNNDAVITKGELSSVLYNMLFSNVLDVNSVSYDKNGDIALSFEEGEILVAKAFHLTAHTGQIRATNYASIYGDKTSSEDMINIEGQFYNSNVDVPLEYLGKHVDFYLTEDDVVFAILEKANTIYTVTSGDLSTKTNAKQVIFTEDEKEKTLNISSDAFYMYNGSPIIGPSDSQMKPQYGRLEIIDNGNDRKIDVVKIWDYKSYYVKSVTSDKIFVAENEDDITYVTYRSDTKTTAIFNKNMEPVNAELIIAGKVVTIAENDDSIIIMLSDDVFEGVLESVTSDNKAYISGLEYKYLPSCKLDNAFGKSVKYYIDVNETLVYSNSIDETDYAVLYGIEQPSGFDSIIRLKLYYEGYFDIYECKEKINLSTDGGQTFKKISCDTLYNEFLDGQTSGIKKQLIKFETRNNKIVSIICADTSTTEVNEEVFRRNLEPADNKEWNMGNRQVMYNTDNRKQNYMWSNTDTYIYIISDKEKECTYSTMEDLYGGHYAVYKNSPPSYKYVSGYNLTESGYLKHIVVELKGEESSGVEYKITETAPLALITGRKTVLDTDGSAIEVITAYTNENGSTATPIIENLSPKDITLTNCEKTRNNNEAYPKGSVKFSELEPGDIIQYKKDSFTGRITNFAVLVRSEDIKNDICTNTEFSLDLWDAIISGIVSEKDDFCVKITGSKISHDTYGNSVPIMMNTKSQTTENFDKIYRYISDSQKFELITPSDIYEGARVWCYVEDKFYQYGVILVIVE